MSVKSAPFYWLECDGCGDKSTLDGEYAAWGDVSGAEDDARGIDWLILDDRHFCSDCTEWCQGFDPSGGICEAELVPKGERCNEAHADEPVTA